MAVFPAAYRSFACAAAVFSGLQLMAGTADAVPIEMLQHSLINQPAPAAVTPFLVVHRQTGQFSADIRNMPIHAVARAVTREYGIGVTYPRSSAERRIDARFSNLPLPEAVTRLFPEFSFAYYCELKSTRVCRNSAVPDSVHITPRHAVRNPSPTESKARAAPEPGNDRTLMLRALDILASEQKDGDSLTLENLKGYLDSASPLGFIGPLGDRVLRHPHAAGRISALRELADVTGQMAGIGRMPAFKSLIRRHPRLSRRLNDLLRTFLHERLQAAVSAAGHDAASDVRKAAAAIQTVSPGS